MNDKGRRCSRRARDRRVGWSTKAAEVITIALLLAPGCSASSDGVVNDAGAPGLDGQGVEASACDVRIAPSDEDQSRVQTALIETPAGSTICFESGEFRFTDQLTLSSRGVTLRGSPTTVWDFRNQRTSARNGLLVTGSAFTIEDFAIKNTPGDGVRVEGAEGVTFRKLRVSWEADALRPDDGGVGRSGAYAVYPVTSSKVLIEDCEVTGARDAGLYVGQSHDIIVRNNKVHGNVAGIEIENSTDSEVYGNTVYDNTAGILVFNLPDLPVQDGRRANVHDNDVRENNHVNFAIPGTTVAGVPVGTGLLVLAADDTEIHANTFRSNDSTGVLIVSCFTNNSLEDCHSTVTYDQFPQQTYVHGNTYEGNGMKPDPAFALLNVARLEDVAWDGDIDASKPNETVICVQETAGTFRDFNARGFFANPSTDVTPHQCMLPPLPPITL
ncbi:MAG TPA: parallel beta-helix domain-containing protein [Polyangiaceae bacterium]|nr:parallel beta-helix domain-containing protein [Polyangiaceae bacterium]